MPKHPPRPYQIRMLQDVQAALRQRQKRIAVQLATGAGKTYLAAMVVTQTSPACCLFIVPSIEILRQTQDTLEDFDLPYVLLHGPGKTPNLRSHALVLTTSQTLHARLDSAALLNADFDMVIVDEIHKLPKQHRSIQGRWPSAVFIGFTATPVRLDGQNLAALFSLLICGPPYRALQRDGWLVPAIVVRASMPDLSKCRMLAGDFHPEDLDEAYAADEIIREMVRSWQAQARGRPTICFTAGVRASKRLAASYQRAGVRALHVDASTPTPQREQALAALRQGNIELLCNVGLFVEGIDVIEIACVQMAVDTFSLSKYMQMVGRGMRPAPAKRNLLVLDHSQNSDRHGPVDADRDWFQAGAVTRETLCLDCNEIVTIRGQKRCTPHLKAFLARHRYSPVQAERQLREARDRTPERPVPQWARAVAAIWQQCEAARIHRQLPLDYTEKACKRALAGLRFA